MVELLSATVGPADAACPCLRGYGSATITAGGVRRRRRAADGGSQRQPHQLMIRALPAASVLSYSGYLWHETRAECTGLVAQVVFTTCAILGCWKDSTSS